ncbi:MAG: ATP-binding cassette domain-containing protein [Bacillus sp. (in: firmicutes)]
MNEYAVKASHVSKRIDHFPLVDDLSFQIAERSKVAILGHNGSGKSSLLKLIAGIYRPSSGEMETFNKIIGYTPEHFPENMRFRLGEFLLHVGMMSGRDQQEVKKDIALYSEMFQMEPYLHTQLKDCSKGTKQKAGLIQAVLTNCDILLLDEPMTGLDEESKQAFVEMINRMERDMTLIFTAHEQETVDLLADEVIILENGKLVRQEALTEQMKQKRIVVKIPTHFDLEEVKMYGKIVSRKDNIVELSVPARESDKCLFYLLNNNSSIMEVKETI